MSFFASYYRTDREDILNARKVDEAGNLVVANAGRAFAALFNATPYFSQGLAPHFLGVGFSKEQRIVQGLWAPAIPGVPLRKPADPRKVPNKLRAQYVALCERWNEALPADAVKPRQSEFLKVLGRSEGDYVNGHQLHLFMEGDVMYIISTLPLALPEVNGSDLRAAQDRVEAEAAKVPELVQELAARTEAIVEAANGG